MKVDGTIDAIEYAMKALALRSEVTANNIANAHVPGFHSLRVKFEDKLQRALASGGIAEEPGVADAGGTADQFGNTVKVEDEVVEMIKNDLLQDAMIGAFNFKIGLLRNVITGGER